MPVDVGDFREGAPQCQEAGGRFVHQQDGYIYPDCPGGFDEHYDMSLWRASLVTGLGHQMVRRSWSELKPR